MTSLITTFENWQRLAVTAAEEAHRCGHPEVGVEHLFLALLMSQTDAGRRLREQGIGLDEAREAARVVHAQRLAVLGIPEVPDSPRPFPAEGPATIDWNSRALELFSHGSGDRTGLSLLRSLVVDPGGFVGEMLAHLGIDISAALVDDPVPADPQDTSPDGSVTYRAFVPAPVASVWALLDDPSRRPEWDTAAESVDLESADTLICRAAVRTGTWWRVPHLVRTRWVRLTHREEPARISWDITFPDAWRPRGERLEISLAKEHGGTALTLSLRPAGRRRWARIGRFLAAVELTRIASGISRVFRA